MVPSNDHYPARSSRATWTDELGIKQLLTHFNRLIQSPQSVQRLRRFILDLAVRGKLVPQDPKDEPASELLKRIAKKKRQMEKVDGRKKQKSIPTLTEQDLPFPLPTNWKWGQIAEIGLLSPRNEAADDLPASFIPMPMIPATYGATCRHEVRQWGDIKKGYTHFVEGDVGLAKITPCFQNGKSVVFRNLTGGMGSGTTELHVVRPIFVDPDFIALFLKCPHFIETGIPRMTGTAGQKRVPSEYFAHSPFPLPPLPEQHRIVAKVDELMALCDRLEAAQTERETRRTHLTATSLARLNTPAPDQATFREHVAFTLENIAPLTTRPDQIKNLRQTILNLAVRGKLVPQNPNDEPASELLERIAKEKARLVKAKKIRKFRLIADSEDVSSPFKIPTCWQWVRLDAVGVIVGGGTPSANEAGNFTEPGTGIPWLTPADLGGFSGSFISHGARDLSEKGLQNSSASLMPVGTVLFTSRAPIGYVAIAANPVSTNQGFKSIVPYVPDCSRFIALAMKTFAPEINAIAPGTTFKEVSGKIVAGISFPLPPLAEQGRIVAKVDKLMGLCDQLETSLAAEVDMQRHLLVALPSKTLR